MAIDRVDHVGAIPTIVAQEALGYLARYGSLASLVSRDYDSQVASYGDTINIFKRGSLVVQNKTADTALTFADPTGMSTVPVTLNAHKAVTFKLEDPARFVARPNLLEGYAQDAAQVLGEAVDDALLALATDAAVTTQVGAAGTAITRATFVDARTSLNTAKAPRGDRALVLSTDVAGQAVKDSVLASSASNDTAVVDVASGTLKNSYGFVIAENQGVTTTAGTPNRVNNMAFARNAIALVTRPLPAPSAGGIQYETVQAGGMSIRVLMDYDIANLAMVVVLDILFGVKIVRPEHVIRVAA